VVTLEASGRAAVGTVSLLEDQLQANGIVPVTQGGSSSAPGGDGSTGPTEEEDDPLSPGAMLGVGLASGMMGTLAVVALLMWVGRGGSPQGQGKIQATDQSQGNAYTSDANSNTQNAMPTASGEAGAPAQAV